jgi:mono/diheme cytochrome c family protein
MRLLLWTTLLAATFSAAAAAPADAVRGRLLYELHCHGCHYRNVHFRPRRKVHTPEQLRREVDSWARSGGLRWQARDVDDVAAWLDWVYYGFRLPGYPPWP